MSDDYWFVQSALMLRRLYGISFERDWGHMGITAAEGLMLKTISCNEGITASKLGNKMGYNKSLVTKNMKMLKEHEFVREDKIDGRMVAIHTSQKGKDFLEDADVKGKEFVERVFAGCTPDEKIEFFKILRKLNLE